MFVDSLNLTEQEIRTELARLPGLPCRPTPMLRLIEALHVNDASAADIGSLILFEPSFAASVLRHANSSRFGLRGKISILSQAVDVIGLDEIRSLCTCALLAQPSIGDTDDQHIESFWKHALLTARMAREIVRKRPWIGEEEAFTLGLLHDLGKSVMMTSFKDQYDTVTSLARNRNIPCWYAELECGFMHTVIGKWLCLLWGLPEVFQHVTEFHHRPEQTPSFRPEVGIIHLADSLAHALDCPELLTDIRTVSSCRRLNITAEEWNGYLQRLNEIGHEVKNFWNLVK